MSEGGKEAERADDEVVAASQVRRLEERVRELERLLGGKTLEVEILKEGSSRRSQNSDLGIALVAVRRYPVMVSATLRVARSKYRRRRDGTRSRRGCRSALPTLI